MRRVSPAVSVVIPAYNTMRYLPTAVDSVLKQTFQDFELVIVNDGSQDHIESWYEQLPALMQRKIRLISQSNQGTCRARNAGIRHAQGAYIAFLDADDVWLPQKLARQIDWLQQHPHVSLVYCWSIAVDNAGQPVGHIYAEHLASDAWAGLVERNTISTPSVVLVRRDCLESVGNFDVDLNSFVEDKDLWLRIARDYTIHCLPEILVHKRRHEANNSKKWQAMAAASYRVIDKALASPPYPMTGEQVETLKRRSCARTNQQMAWKPLQTEPVNTAAAWRFLKSAWQYQKQLIVSKETLKLLVALSALLLLGTRRYRRLQKRSASWRYRISAQRLSTKRNDIPL